MHRLSVAIQTHPKRDLMARALQERLPGSELAVDPNPAGYRSPWRTYRHALASTPEWATHRLVIQDDTDLCVNFMAAVARVIAARPHDPIALFISGLHRAGVQALMHACDRDQPFAVIPPGPVWVPAVAVIWPTAIIRPALDWIDKQHYGVKFTADDEIIGRALRALGHRVLCTVPSLVEHHDMVPSITGKQAQLGLDPNRVAWCFIGGDPLDVNWEETE